MNLHSLYDAASNWSVVRLPRCEIELPFHCHHHVCYGFLSIILLNLKVLSFSRLPHGPFPLPSPHHLSGILVLGSAPYAAYYCAGGFGYSPVGWTASETFCFKVFSKFTFSPQMFSHYSLWMLYASVLLHIHSTLTSLTHHKYLIIQNKPPF